MAAHQLDFLLLTKPNFAQAIRQLRWRIQALNTHGSARHDAAKGAKLGFAMAGFEASWHARIHVSSDVIVIETRFQQVFFDFFKAGNRQETHADLT